MASSLKNKLNRMKAASEPREARPAPRAMEFTARFPAEEGLFSIREETLSRMGFEGTFDPERTLFFDTETTGLSGGTGTVAFLIGLGRVEGRDFVVRQYFMPDYAAEPVLLENVLRISEGCDTAVTFNGKSFDVPLLASRFIMNRMDNPIAGMRQIDLIHPARRTWKLRLKDCSLGNIEDKVLGMKRENDLPGSEAPERYFSFLKTRDMRLMEDVIAHNRQDIVSLSSLLVKLHAVYSAPAEQMSMLDVFSVGRALEKQGDRQEAGRCYRLAAQARPLTDLMRLQEARMAPAANRNLSLMLRRGGDRMGAEKVWREMIRRGQMGAFPYVELAKALEHRDGQYEAALELVERAMPLTDDEREKAKLEARRARLLRRIHQKNESREDG